MKYYVYAYFDSTKLYESEHLGFYFKYQPIYIGKGQKRRMYEHLRDRKRFKNMFYNKLNKMIKNENYPIIEKICEFDEEELAYNFEKSLIQIIRNIKNNGKLYNSTEGGKGVCGYHYTKEVREKMRENAIKNKIHLKFPPTNGENHPMWGKKHNLESKQKMSIKRKERVTTDETKKKISNSHKGKKLSDEHKKKLSISNNGKKREESTKIKISEAKKGTKPWNFGLSKFIIIQMDMNENIIKEWQDLVEIEKAEFQKSNVINVCKGKRKSHFGYIWRYKI